MDDLLYFMPHRVEISFAANSSQNLVEAQATFPAQVPVPALELNASARMAIATNAFYSSELDKDTVVINGVSYLRRRRLFVDPNGTVRVVDNYLSTVWCIEAEYRNK